MDSAGQIEAFNYKEDSELIDPNLQSSVFVRFTPFGGLHFAIFHALRCAKRPWTDLNKAIKITYPEWTMRSKEKEVKDDEYDESNEYPKIEIEFADQPVRNLTKTDYCVDYILYEFSTKFEDYKHKFTDYKGRKKLLLTNREDIRYWCGIKFEGNNGNFCTSSETDDIEPDKIHVYTFSGEVG